MTRHAKHRVAALLASGLLLAVGACWLNRPGRGVDSTVRLPSMLGMSTEGITTDLVEPESGPDSGDAALRITSGDTLIAARKTPALPKRIENMSNLDLDLFLPQLFWKPGGYNSHSANVPCVHGSSGTPCSGSDSAHVFIQPEAGMNKREITDIPANGLIVARIINDARVDLDEAVFGYPAQRKTYWVVDSAGGTLRSRYFVRTFATPAVEFLKHPWAFTHCPHADAPAGRAARAKFWTCLESTADSTLAMRRISPRERQAPTLESYIHPASLRIGAPLPEPAAPLMLQSNWVSCGSGCCATM